MTRVGGVATGALGRTATALIALIVALSVALSASALADPGGGNGGGSQGSAAPGNDKQSGNGGGSSQQTQAQAPADSSTQASGGTRTSDQGGGADKQPAAAPADQAQQQSEPADRSKSSDTAEEARSDAPGQAKRSPAETATPSPTVAAAPAPAVASPPAAAPAPARQAPARRSTTSTRSRSGPIGASGVASPPPPPVLAGPIGSSLGAGAGDSGSGGSRGAGNGGAGDDGNDDSAPLAPVVRTVRDVVEVVPTGVWLALGAAGLLVFLFALLTAIEARRARRLVRKQQLLLADLGALQEAILPVVPQVVGGLELSTAHRPFAGPAAGGDFRDVIPLRDGRVAVVVGDIAGHGPEGLSKAALVRFTLRAHLEAGADAREALAIAGAAMSDHFDDDFATVAVAVHDPGAATLTYATAAHDAPLVLGPGAHEPVFASATPPLGAGGRTARRQTVVPFPANSLVCLLTDGLLEARTRRGLVGRDRLERLLSELGPNATADELFELVSAHATVQDDVAICIARARVGEDTGRWRQEELHLSGGYDATDEAASFLIACGVDAGDRLEALAAVHVAGGHVVVSVRMEDGRPVDVTVRPTPAQTPVAA